MSTQLQPASEQNALSIFDSGDRFDHYQRVAKAISSSSLVPEQFKGNISNTLIALDMADRLKANPLAVMQSIYIVHGKPSWAATFVISMVNSCGRFSSLRFDVKGEGDDKTCIAWTKEKETGERIEGPPVSIRMAKDEGWCGKTGSKWKTMPELMLRYRAATFFGRLYAPELLLGMQTAEEVIDVETVPVMQPSKPLFGPILVGDGKAQEPATGAPQTEPANEPPAGNPPEKPDSSTVKESVTVAATPNRAALAAFLTENEFTFSAFQNWAVNMGFPGADTWTCIDEVPEPVAASIIRKKSALQADLKEGSK